MEGEFMRACIAASALLFGLFGSPAHAQDRTFGGFECTEDCSGHKAGYDWAERKNIEDEADCPDGNSQSFHEGCEVYTQDPNRGSDDDDQGHEAGAPLPMQPDADDDDGDDK